MVLVLIFIPLFFAGVAAVTGSNRFRPWLLPPAALGHFAASMLLLARPDPWPITNWLLIDPPGRLVLLAFTTLFLICAFYCTGYLRLRSDRPNRVFCVCMLIFPAAATLVICSANFGLMWLAVDASTLSTAPLIFFNRTAQSLEATWKYLIICSVGIALALLGTFFLAYSSLQPVEPSTQPVLATTMSANPHSAIPSMLMNDLVNQARNRTLSIPWLKAAFVLLLIGYGTKMGLVPMHTWKPDVYGEAPGVVGALLAGGLTSCAFLMLLRVARICAAAGITRFADSLLVLMGLLSMAVAGAFLVDQKDFKRMLAYSSVEHMGILAIGLGVGGVAVYGALLHVINNALTKGVLFLCAGNIHRAYGGKTTATVRGVLRRLPVSGAFFLLGFFAITGAPPFGPFISQLTILTGVINGGRYLVAALFLLFLLLVFFGMGRTVQSMLLGRPPAATRHTAFHDGPLTTLPIVAALGVVLLLGLYIPGPLREMLLQAAAYVGGGS
ncbi:MAG TPA: proton-conducting transporter membrane subunit [Phycisphaerae bacterium]|nr:proton-conducting transporter membrane subunit [Phycisphaerae bacterium]